MSTPTTIELCAGIGGFSSQYTQALAYVEIDPACRAVLKRHYGDALILDDVRTCGAHNLPWANVIKFGFPCQDLSVAGKRGGLAGARSGLFYECTRIVNELRPDFAVWENVPGLLSSDSGRDFARVLMELDRIGYSGCWTTLDAQFFGVAQRRQRVFGVFARRDIGAAVCAEILSLTARLPWNTETGGTKRARVAATIRGGPSRDGGERDVGAFAWHRTNADVSDGDTPSLTVSDSHAPAVYSAAIAQSNRGRDSDVFETVRAGSHGALPMVSVIKGAANGRAPENGPQYGEVLDDGTCYTLNCTEVHAVAAFTERGRDGGCNVEMQDDLAYALRDQTQGGAQVSKVMGSFGVRRLTPLECERLQGFPDGWTAGQADSTRYRQLGNAVCRTVSAWLDSQIAKYYDH